MKQWEGVNANGLPTPVVNFLKRVVGHVTASVASENLHMNASPLAAYPGDDELVEPARIVNEEFEAIMERVNLPKLVREFTRNSSVDGDGCLHVYWDSDAKTGQKDVEGQIGTEIVENTRVFFGNPNDRSVQTQPWIIVAKRATVRSARLAAKNNGQKDYMLIQPDGAEFDDAVDSAKQLFDKVTQLLIYWRDDKTREIWAYETTKSCEVKAAWNMGISLYPIVWLPWDYILDCYHGQAMITGLIPNQIFVNKALAMSMMSMMRSAWPKVVYDRTRVSKWDNRVGGAIGVAGSVEGVAKILDPAQISPQIAQYIQMVINETQAALGATEAALGEGKAYNTSAILSLQKASQTPVEMTKQDLYQQIEDLGRIWLEFMAEYYGERVIDTETPEKVKEYFGAMNEETGVQVEPPKRTQVLFDFSTLKNHPMSLKLDVGASSYYSEIASATTLDNLLMNGQITILQYLERIPDDRIAGRRKLIDELKEQQAQQEAMMQAQMEAQQMMPAGEPEQVQNMPVPDNAPEAQDGYQQLQRALEAVSQ